MTLEELLARNAAVNRLTVDGLGVTLDKLSIQRRLKHYRAALALTDKLRDPKHRAYLAESETVGQRVYDPGYRDTRRGVLKRIIAHLEGELGAAN